MDGSLRWYSEQPGVDEGFLFGSIEEVVVHHVQKTLLLHKAGKHLDVRAMSEILLQQPLYRLLLRSLCLLRTPPYHVELNLAHNKGVL